MDVDQGHPIRVVVGRTGLNPHVIRVWEKRYQAVKPMRTETNRRRYSDEDIERLLLFQRATQSGRSIGQIAHLTTEQLRALVHDDEAMSAVVVAVEEPSADAPETAALDFDRCLAAIRELDGAAFERMLMQARVGMSQPMFIEQLIVRLMVTIGGLWREGELRIAHEHLASAVVRTVLGSLSAGTDISSLAPKVVVATPLGQWHEVGALVAASTAVSEGWKVVYLGANLPAEEIAAAVQQQEARAVALSMVYPADDPRVPNELLKLRRYLPKGVEVLVGGRGCHGYKAVLDTIGALCLSDLSSLRHYLETLRSLEVVQHDEC